MAVVKLYFIKNNAHLHSFDPTNPPAPVVRGVHGGPLLLGCVKVLIVLLGGGLVHSMKNCSMLNLHYVRFPCSAL